MAFNPPLGSVGSDGNNYVWLFDGGARRGYINNLLMRTDGTIVFAVSYGPMTTVDTNCWVRAAAARDGYAVFNLYWGQGPMLANAQNLLYHAPIAQISTVSDPVQVVDGSTGREAFILDVGARGVTWMLLGGATSGILDGAPFTPFDGEWPNLVGTDVLTTQSGGVHLRTADGTNAELINIAPRRFLTDALTDGRYIAWFDDVDTGVPADTRRTVALHAAPYARTASAFVPRIVEMGPPDLFADEFAMGDGLVAHTADATGSGYHVVDLATGVVRSFTAPPGEGPRGLFLVSAHELVFQTWNTDNTLHRLYVVDPATLPLVPPISTDSGVPDAGIDAG